MLPASTLMNPRRSFLDLGFCQRSTRRLGRRRRRQGIRNGQYSAHRIPAPPLLHVGSGSVRFDPSVFGRGCGHGLCRLGGTWTTRTYSSAACIPDAAAVRVSGGRSTRFCMNFIPVKLQPRASPLHDLAAFDRLQDGTFRRFSRVGCFQLAVGSSLSGAVGICCMPYPRQRYFSCHVRENWNGGEDKGKVYIIYK